MRNKKNHTASRSNAKGFRLPVRVVQAFSLEGWGSGLLSSSQGITT